MINYLQSNLRTEPKTTFKLSKPITPSKLVKEIKQAKESPKVGERCITAGWGAIKEVHILLTKGVIPFRVQDVTFFLLRQLYPNIGVEWFTHIRGGSKFATLNIQSLAVVSRTLDNLR